MTRYWESIWLKYSTITRNAGSTNFDSTFQAKMTQLFRSKWLNCSGQNDSTFQAKMTQLFRSKWLNFSGQNDSTFQVKMTQLFRSKWLNFSGQNDSIFSFSVLFAEVPPPLLLRGKSSTWTSVKLGASVKSWEQFPGTYAGEKLLFRTRVGRRNTKLSVKYSLECFRGFYEIRGKFFHGVLLTLK